LLDTAIVSSPISQKPSAEVLKKLAEHGHECAIAAPVWNELRYGCERMAKGKRRDALETYLNDVVLASFEVLSYDQQAAQWHGVERARLEKVGKTAPFVDGQIASIAHTNDLILVTTNVKDFNRYKGLKIENWAS
jgi:tRNA(fMet)-specific endonuclease VapC